ncbi:MAG: SDR family oxidoreductase [Candidatus Omnitrophota bacterium]|jgi:dTDP-4-dehydrorhamnose reductase
MKLLIIGASGVLGSRLYNDTIKNKWNVTGTFCSHEREGLSCLDVSDKNGLEKIFYSFKPEVVVMAGGITNVDLCTLKPKLAEDVNINGTLNLVRKIKEYGSKLVHISTDYIFDGKNGPYKEEDKTNPINKYGETKLEAENIIRSKLKNYLIVRTAQLCGIDHTGKNFVLKIIQNMKSGKKVYAANDLYSTPTYSGLLSDIIIKLIEKKAAGIYHGAGSEFINRYDYVNKIADVFGLDKSLIQRVELKDLELIARRPKKGGLRVDKVMREKITVPYDCGTGLEFLKKDMDCA